MNKRNEMRKPHPRRRTRGDLNTNTRQMARPQSLSAADRTSRPARRPARSSRSYAHVQQDASPSRRRLLAAVAAIALVLVVFVVAGVLSRSNETTDSADSYQQQTSHFDPSNLSQQDGRYAYTVDGTVLSRTGVDVSQHQGTIDWQSVADDGIEFAYVRVGYRGVDEGSVHLDSTYEQNLEGARSAGLDVGVYFFSQATSADEAIEEAVFVLEQLDGADLDAPVVFDLETNNTSDRTYGMTREEYTAVANTFCERVEAAGYETIIYGNQTDISRYNLSDLGGRLLWFASYDGAPPMRYAFAYWQYSDSARIDGISTPVDIDLDLSALYS